MKRIFIFTSMLFYMGVVSAQTTTVYKGRPAGTTTIETENTKVTAIKCDNFFQHETCYTSTIRSLSGGLYMSLQVYARTTDDNDVQLEGIVKEYFIDKGDKGISESTFTFIKE